MKSYWIAIACKEHVQRGVQGGFAQVCHGKPGPLNQMQEEDGILYYSPTLTFGGKQMCQAFTAIGKIAPGDPYLFAMSEDFIPWRRNVCFLKSKDASIHPLINQLSFIENKQKWGFPFRRGCFKIPQNDFQIIACAMEIPQ